MDLSIGIDVRSYILIITISELGAVSRIDYHDGCGFNTMCFTNKYVHVHATGRFTGGASSIRLDNECSIIAMYH